MRGRGRGVMARVTFAVGGSGGDGEDKADGLYHTVLLDLDDQLDHHSWVV